MGSFHYMVLCETESPALADAFEAWLVEGHLGEVCAAGALEAEVIRRDDRVTVECRYLFASRDAFLAYERDHAPRLRMESRAKFPSGVTFHRATGVGRHRARIDGLRVEIVPYGRDNYAYLLHTFQYGARGKRPCVIIDPGDAGPVLAALVTHALEPVAIWCTHHHPDHVAGIPALLRELTRTEGHALPVLGSQYDLDTQRIPQQSRGLVDGEELDLLGHVFHAVAVPGHTLGAVAYVGEGMAFTGDTLFLGGCGRVFEGTMSMMHASLARLSALDGDTRLYVGHEYTEANLVFAAHVEPDSQAITERLAAVRARRSRGEPTVPGTMREEHVTNPFLRCHLEPVASFARARGSAPDAVEVFTQVREAKNAF